jgi:hypothetical protein
MGFKALSISYGKKAALLAKDRQKEALVMGSDGHALTANRIQNEGVGSDGQAFKKYSQKRMPYWLLNPNNFNAAGKINNFKKAAKEGKNNASYSALRSAYGLPTDKRTLTFDGSMFKSIGVTVESHDALQTTVVIKANNEEQQDKVNFNSAQLKTNILEFGATEKALIKAMNLERINKVLRVK